MVRLLRPEIVLVFALAAIGATFISMVQLHTNDDRLVLYKNQLKRRKLVLTALKQMEETSQSTVSELEAHKKKVLNGMRRQSGDGDPEALVASFREELYGASVGNDVVKDGSDGVSAEKQSPSNSDPQRTNDKSHDSEGSRNQQHYPRSLHCDQRTSVDPTEETAMEYMDPVDALLGVRKITGALGKRAKVDSLGNELRPMVKQFEQLIHQSNKTLQHFVDKMEHIDRLWPRWFDAKTNTPIYRDIFAPDAKMHESHEEGLKLHVRYNVKKGGEHGGKGMHERNHHDED